ncbi:chitinase domain-containing protein 1 precursor [Reticulomyxa filosa]|uniref:Chitinase domain-containing protein 1 n=1 Tax=Reticulomyxa filosa TaxID=46433 RepID=X6NJG4_RETFI|nr:chitinase domain-containing protein 1 precursor [Reticulomyxa filosa]|eukprot:ETO26435.1 chitinase domain-containing protein 1 precursor [Reticulomyxa filosa]
MYNIRNVTLFRFLDGKERYYNSFVKEIFGLLLIQILFCSVFSDKAVEVKVGREKKKIEPNKQTNKKKNNVYKCTKRGRSGITLGFLTPQNAKGYAYSVEYVSKYTHLAPVWFQIKRYGHSYLLLGENVMNKEWMKTLRAKSASIRIVPRFYFGGEDWSLLEVQNFLQAKAAQRTLIGQIVRFIRLQQLDGCVIEFIGFFNWLANVIQGKHAALPDHEKVSITPDVYAKEQKLLLTFIVRS